MDDKYPLINPIAGLPVASPLPGVIPMDNFKAAMADLNLSQPEQALYQYHLNNLYGGGGVDNADGTRSTIYSVGFDHDGQYRVIPSVYDGKILPPDEAIARAQKAGLDQFPAYPDAFTGENRYQRLHNYMERDTEALQRGR